MRREKSIFVKHLNALDMKRNTFYVIVCILLVSCSGSSSKKDLNELKQRVDSLQKVADVQRTIITALKDSVSVLAFPADQRLLKIKELVASEDYSNAKTQIVQLKNIFPNSFEASACKELETIIATKEAAKEAEAERLKSLGFKALSAKTSFTIGYNTMTLSRFSIGTQFVYDAYDDSWFYSTADRGNKYITASMSIKSTDKDPNIPEFAVYSVTGDKMKFVERFQTRYARWRDYGAYLGNYHDTSNDFAKVSTVKFKLGAEVSDDVILKAFAIVCKKENGLTSAYDRFDNPPKSWVGSVSYPSTLSVSDFESDYVLVKLYNL